MSEVGGAGPSADGLSDVWENPHAVTLSEMTRILRGVYPESEMKRILRYAQDDK